MYEYKRYATKKQWKFLLTSLPDPKQKRLGRRRCSKEALILGILQVIKTGCRWRDINSGCSGVSCWRYFNELQRRGTWKRVFQLSILVKQRRRKKRPVRKALDCKLIPNPKFKRGVGYSRKHKANGTKVSLEVDEKGGIDGIVIDKGNVHDIRLAQTTIKNSLSNGAKKAISLTADKGYDSSSFRRWLRKKHIKQAIPTRNYKHSRKKGRPFTCNPEYYQMRYIVERTNGWLEGFRRLKARCERKLANFTAMIFLALILINIRL